jgi:hypothetical protein
MKSEKKARAELRPSKRELSRAPFPGTFYVFLHGLIASRRNGKFLDLLIPDVGPNHVYRYGEFLGELTLQPAAPAYQIRGIEGKESNPSQTIFPPEAHLCTNGLFGESRGSKLYARIRLPHPLQVHSYLTVDLKDVVTDPANQMAKSKTGNMTPVLEYKFSDPRNILFGGEPLNIAPLEVDGRWYMNLHLYAEEDVERPELHTVAGFNQLAELFDFGAPPSIASVTNIPEPVRGKLPKGTSELEFVSLAMRTRELGYLGRQIREQSVTGKPIVVKVSSVGADPITCLQAVSQ